MRTCQFGLFALLLALITGCEHADPLDDGGPPEATFSNIQTNIFNQSCALSNCHIGGNAPPNNAPLDLSAGQAYDALVGVVSGERPNLLRVDPGNPDQSYLVMKIEGAAGIAGQRMPLGRTPLSSDQIATVRQWISDGAPRN